MTRLFLGAAACCFLHPLALAHPDHDTAPGQEIDRAVRTGNGEWLFEAVPHWGEFPDDRDIGPTHGGVVVDPQTGEIFASTDAAHAILVWKPDGTFVRSIAPECQGFHAMDIRVEQGKTVIYGAQLAGPKPLRVCKLDTSGRLLLEVSEATAGQVKGGWDGLTGVAVAPDGSIFCSMGYGAQFIHKFDAEGKWLSSFGGRGSGDQVLTETSHGLKIDLRYGEPRLLICDRENRRLIHTDLEGRWIGEYASHLRRPCSVSISGDFCAVAELEARVTILDKDGTPVAFLGDNPDRGQWANFPVPKEDLRLGIFTAPHGISFDQEDNLYVEDWNVSGRVTKLRRIKP
ncbi:6-bladed beta-propeller [Haloferula sargassicola]|uniref:NHL repeat protein n=1 Tax=Haloferula sargassicola TaxID=490096 RepID=A0ABP9URH0_9BACT